MQDFLSVYGCGFNGFSQLDNFGNTQICGLSGRDIIEAQGNNRKKVEHPNFLFQLDKNVCVLYRLVISWAQIGITVKDGSGCFRSFASGLISTVKHGAKEAKKCVDNLIAMGSTDSYLLFSCPAEPNLCIMLSDGTVNPQSVKIRVEGDSKIQHICGGHKEMFVGYDEISFGKLAASAIESDGKETLEPKEDQSIISFDLVPIDSGLPIQEISCGKEHALLLSKHGCIYSYGLGSRGQLGHGDAEAESVPRLVEALEGVPIISVSAGGWHSAAVSKIGDLYVWGWNESGQLGISSSAVKNKETHLSSFDDEGVGIQSQPYCLSLPGDVNVMQVACGSRHTVLLTDTHKALTSGWNAYGQLGLGNTQSRDEFTTVTALSEPCIRIYAGKWNTFFVCELKE